MRQLRFSTPHGIDVARKITKVPYRKGLRRLLGELDAYRGFYLSSGYEYPGRYSRWDIASVRPPLEILARGRHVEFRPLHLRGEMLIQILLPVIEPRHRCCGNRVTRRHTKYPSFLSITYQNPNPPAPGPRATLSIEVEASAQRAPASLQQ